jgi:hypothetical protein
MVEKILGDKGHNSSEECPVIRAAEKLMWAKENGIIAVHLPGPHVNLHVWTAN